MEDRVDSAVEERQSLDQRVDGIGDDKPILGPDVDRQTHTDGQGRLLYPDFSTWSRCGSGGTWIRWTTKYGVQQPMNAPTMLSVICTKQQRYRRHHASPPVLPSGESV